MICSSCGLDKQHLRGAMIDGIFDQYCRPCLEAQKRPSHAGSAAYSRAKDRDDHEFDLIQPWDLRGVPNKEFIRNYPEESKEMYTDDELKEFG